MQLLGAVATVRQLPDRQNGILRFRLLILVRMAANDSMAFAFQC
jgi:hypothetical protein